MKYLEALLARRAEGSDRPAASPTSRRVGTDKTDKSPALASADPFVGFVGAAPEHLAGCRPDPPPPGWPPTEGDRGPALAADSRVEAFEERAAILEYDAGIPREEAERRADPEVADYFKPTGLLD